MFYLTFFVLISGLIGGWIGQSRKIGYWGGFVVSALLNMVGWIITAYSPKLVAQKNVTQSHHDNPNNIQLSTSSTTPGLQRELTIDISGADDPLSELDSLKQSGFLTDAEFEELKNKLK